MEPIECPGIVSYHKDLRSFSGFVSDMFGSLRERDGKMPTVVRIKSKLTGNVREFTYRSVDVDREGDVRFWVYKNDELGCELHVFND